MPYRVFISYKHTSMDGKGVTKDYAIAADLHRTLTQAGILTFFSEKDLSTGDYVNEIYDALEEADIMIVVGTKPEHIRSKWVREEWSTFGAAINGGLKPNGDLYTYLEGMSVSDLPMMLFKRQSYTTREKDTLVQRVKTQLGVKDEPEPLQESKSKQQPVPKPVPIPQPVQEIKSKPQPVQEIKPKPAKEPATKTPSVKRTPIIVTVAVVLVMAIVGGIWAVNTFVEKTGDQIKAFDLAGLDATYNGSYYTFTFGSYPQGADGEEQLIEWRVLAVKNGKALVISEKLLDCVRYNDEDTSVTWETCTLRSWMNNDFLSTAFSTSEQVRIATVANQNPDNPKNGTNGGNTTEDKIFALSIDEAEKYFRNADDRMTAPTEYAMITGACVSGDYSLPTGEKTGWWWLRSPGNYSDSVAFINSRGSINQIGCSVRNRNVAVRPAFWLNL